MLSNTEREFISTVINDRKRLDGRNFYEFRNESIKLLSTKGCCMVDLGKTKVLSQVSWEITAPKESRPNEGILMINVELSPMACPLFEHGKMTSYCSEITRLLDRCLKESKCIDLESLCIHSGSKVFLIRLDMHALNHDGNLLDAFTIAASASLHHFRRPDVTYMGDKNVFIYSSLESDPLSLNSQEKNFDGDLLIFNPNTKNNTFIHTPDNRDPLPLNILHSPICSSFAFYGDLFIVDPTYKEELVSDWILTVGANKHREICLMQTSGGNAHMTKDQILTCCQIAIKRACDVKDIILNTLNGTLEKTTIDKSLNYKQSKIIESNNEFVKEYLESTTDDSIENDENMDVIDDDDDANEENFVRLDDLDSDIDPQNVSKEEKEKGKKVLYLKDEKSFTKKVKDNKISIKAQNSQKKETKIKKDFIKSKTHCAVIEGGALLIGYGGNSSWTRDSDTLKVDENVDNSDIEEIDIQLNNSKISKKTVDTYKFQHKSLEPVQGSDNLNRINKSAIKDEESKTKSKFSDNTLFLKNKKLKEHDMLSEDSSEEEITTQLTTEGLGLSISTNLNNIDINHIEEARIAEKTIDLTLALKNKK